LVARLNKKPFSVMVRKVFLYVHIHFLQRNHLTSDFGPKEARRARELYKCVENSFFSIFMAAKIRQEFEITNSLEEINVIFVQFVRNPAYIMRENYNPLLNEQFQPKYVI